MAARADGDHGGAGDCPYIALLGGSFYWGAGGCGHRCALPTDPAVVGAAQAPRVRWKVLNPGYRGRHRADSFWEPGSTRPIKRHK